MYKIITGNCMEQLKNLEDNSIDSVVTDPPYGLSELTPQKIAKTMQEWANGNEFYIPKGKGFMNKDWDSFVPPPAAWREVLRVLKPGGHILCFAGSRTVDLMTISLRMAGFEIRDTIMWMYGSGFPKSLDISKALDKQVGAEREVLKVEKNWGVSTASDGKSTYGDYAGQWEVTAPSTDLAKKYQGWGTALKPSYEPVILARKPLSGSVADNVRDWGVGGINIDGCRIGTSSTPRKDPRNGNLTNAHMELRPWMQLRIETGEPLKGDFDGNQGRWPANIIMDEEVGELLDEQSGFTKSNPNPRNNSEYAGFSKGVDRAHTTKGHKDSGGASRFFYVAKASVKEREAGLDNLKGEYIAYGNQAEAELKRGNTEFDSGSIPKVTHRKNFHPTVKPIALMRYLCRLVTPEGGLILDPFTGSGSTGVAACLEGFNFLGIEQNPDYVEITENRIEYWLKQSDI